MEQQVPIPIHLSGHGPDHATRRRCRALVASAILALATTFACDDEPTEPPAPALITLNLTTVELNGVGDTVQLTAEVQDENGQVLAGYAVSWSTSDASVAMVSQTGLVRAEGAGTARVTATAGSVSAVATITVVIDVEREALVALYQAAGGEDWGEKEGWLSDAPISDWYGVETDASGRVVALNLDFNSLSGTVPPEIGDLTELRELHLEYNSLSGTVPPEIGDLTELRQLHLYNNRFSGPIPPEIGDLIELRELWLQFNDLSGSIPPELGNLKALEQLRLYENEFTGPIPGELGNLSSVTRLYMHDNELSGEIPAEMGNLSRLTDLWLGGNELTGPFPIGLTRLANLERLMLTSNPHTGGLPDEIGDMVSLGRLILNNSGLSGPLPAGMTRLDGLGELMADGAALCAPVDDAFQAWLEGVPKRRVASCEEPEDGSVAYLIQAVQSLAYPVPLVAGEEALLRVFALAPAAVGDTIPLVRATFYLNGEAVEVVEIERGSSIIGADVDESALESSANVLVPATVIQPSLEMVVEIDPDGTVDPALGVAQRIPGMGRKAVDVRALPDLEFTLIPFLWSQNPDSSILEITGNLSSGDELLRDIRELLPVGDIDLNIHEPVVTSSNNAFSMLAQTGTIRAAEGGTGYFMGTASGSVTGARGVAFVPGRVSFSIPDSSVMAHELGHNLSLSHAPCGGPAGPDASFPQPDGTIGAWGYNLASGTLVEPSLYDLMSYCDPTWISEFYFTNSLRHRVAVEAAERLVRLAAPTRSLLISGGVDGDGIPYMGPVFVIDAPPSLPRDGGSYLLRGATAAGTEIFRLDFEMPVIAGEEGRGSFAFTLPAQPRWADELARITLSGPDGSITLDTLSDRPAAILRDSRTGRVRGFFTDLPRGTTAEDVASRLALGEPGLEVLFSRGIPGAAAWRR